MSQKQRDHHHIIIYFIRHEHSSVKHEKRNGKQIHACNFRNEYKSNCEISLYGPGVLTPSHLVSTSLQNAQNNPHLA